MSYSIFLESLLRSLFIAFIALGAGSFIVKVFLPQTSRVDVILIPLFLCFFVPPVAVGYGYTAFSYQLIQYPRLNELLYVLIMVSRLAGPAAMFLFFIPALSTRESSHSLFLAVGRRCSLRVFEYFFHTSLWRYFFIFVLVFLFAFNEFELASMMNIKHWSVSLFDAHAQGISLFQGFKLHILPFIVQGVIIIFLCLIPDFLRGMPPSVLGDVKIGGGRFSFFSSIAGISIFVLIIFISFLFPLFFILKSAFRGGLEVFNAHWMFKEIMNSLLFASSATLGIVFISAFLHRVNCFKYRFMHILLFLPILIGVLPFSLMILEIFQLPLINIFYGSPIPLLFALIGWGLPFLIVLQNIQSFSGESESLHSAELLLPISGQAGIQLLWKMRYRKMAWGLLLIFSLTYFNFTAATILAPIEMTTVTERFYNLMHYGESEKLSAVVCVTMIIPILLFFTISTIFKSVVTKWGARA